MKKWYFMSFSLFISSFMVGVALYSPDLFMSNSAPPSETEVAVGIKDFFHIILNNLFVLITLFLGYFSFGLLSLAALIYNGFMFGIIFTNLYANDIPMGVILSGSIFHGIIEVTAFIIAGAWGLKGFLLFKDMDEKLGNGRFIKETRFINRFIYSAVLIIIAGTIEYFISFRILGLW